MLNNSLLAAEVLKDSWATASILTLYFVYWVVAIVVTLCVLAIIKYFKRWEKRDRQKIYFLSEEKERQDKLVEIEQQKLELLKEKNDKKRK